MYVADKLIFSFITSDEEDYLLSAVLELQKYIQNNKNIILGKQYYYDGYLEIKNNISKTSDNNKLFKGNKAIGYINELNQNAIIVNSFFADDSQMEHELLKHYMLKINKISQNIDIESLHVKNGGITELNNILEEHIYSDKKRIM